MPSPTGAERENMVKTEVTRNRIKAGMEFFIRPKNMDQIFKAVLMAESLPDFIIGDGIKVHRKDNYWELTRKNCENVCKGEIGKALWCEYSAGEINILPFNEQSNYVLILNGKDAGSLDEFL